MNSVKLDFVKRTDINAWLIFGFGMTFSLLHTCVFHYFVLQFFFVFIKININLALRLNIFPLLPD